MSSSAIVASIIAPGIMAIDLNEVRRLVIVAMFSDDELFSRIVLKGGNAISLIYRLGCRSSLDVDFSVDGDLEDLENLQQRILRNLEDRFGTAGYSVFDLTLERRPADAASEFNKWGGYRVEFKLMNTETFTRLKGDLETARRSAEVIGPHQQRKFRIEFSKFEYCEPKREAELDSFTVYVYSPEMLVAEKLRAICQQMPEYPNRSKKAARARDFYDIYVLITEANVRLEDHETQELVSNIFGAKEVELDLLGNVATTREFHRPDWSAVRDSVVGKIEDFDFYFDFVVAEVEKSKVLWNK